MKRPGEAKQLQIRARPVQTVEDLAHVGLMRVAKGAAGQIRQGLVPRQTRRLRAGIELGGDAGQGIDLPAKPLDILVGKGRELRQGDGQTDRHRQP